MLAVTRSRARVLGQARSEESIEQVATQTRSGLPTLRAHTESSPSRDDLSLYLTLREAQHALSDESTAHAHSFLATRHGSRLPPRLPPRLPTQLTLTHVLYPWMLQPPRAGEVSR